MVSHLMTAAAGLFSTAAAAGVAEVTQTGPDYAGIAALITAISGLVAVISGALLAWRKSSANEDRVIKALEKLAEREDGDEQ